jgi:hypothetical protein
MNFLKAMYKVHFKPIQKIDSTNKLENNAVELYLDTSVGLRVEDIYLYFILLCSIDFFVYSFFYLGEFAQLQNLCRFQTIWQN